jgi:hypothetical protein
MAIRDITLSSDQFETGAQYRTTDGKVVTLEQVRVEEALPRVDITNAVKGDIFVLRNGEKFTCTGERDKSGDTLVLRGENKQYQFWFWLNGTCRPFGSERDVIELIKGEKPVVSLEGLRVGDRFRVRKGDIFTCERIESCGSPIYAKSSDSFGIYFRWNGQSNMEECSEYEAVERLTPSVFEQVKEAVRKLGEENIEKIVVSQSDWHHIREEADTPDGTAVYIGGLKILCSGDTFAYPQGRFNIRLKLR